MIQPQIITPAQSDEELFVIRCQKSLSYYEQYNCEFDETLAECKRRGYVPPIIVQYTNWLSPVTEMNLEKKIREVFLSFRYRFDVQTYVSTDDYTTYNANAISHFWDRPENAPITRRLRKALLSGYLTLIRRRFYHCRKTAIRRIAELTERTDESALIETMTVLRSERLI